MKVKCPGCRKSFGLSHKGLSWLGSVVCHGCGCSFVPVVNQQPGQWFAAKETPLQYHMRKLTNVEEAQGRMCGKGGKKW